MIDLARVHAKFCRMQERGDIFQWPFNPARIDPPDSAPLFAAALVALVGDDPERYSNDVLCDLAQRGQALLESGAGSLEQGEAAVAEVLAALKARQRRKPAAGVPH
jgi:hypothetical protein